MQQSNFLQVKGNRSKACYTYFADVPVAQMANNVKLLLRDVSEVLVCTVESAKTLDQALTALVQMITLVSVANTNLMPVRPVFVRTEQLV